MAYLPNKAIHPGKTISSVLEREGISQKSLSERTGLSEKHISQIINGEASITIETSLLFENALGGSASFWINIEKNFQETKARLDRQALMKKEIGLVSPYPYNELSKRGYVEPTSNPEKKVENLWKFFGVNSLLSVRATEEVAFRKKEVPGLKNEVIATWLRCGEIEAKKIKVQQFSESALKKALAELREITVNPAEEFSVQAQNILAQAGVSLVYVPHFKGMRVNGATRWFNENPVLQLSLLWSYADIFWFTLFHEIGHILLHGKKEQFIEFSDKDTSADKEKQADELATDRLISKEAYAGFVKTGDFSPPAIHKFAVSEKIHHGIVAGRLCHEKKAGWKDVAKLRNRLRFA